MDQNNVDNGQPNPPNTNNNEKSAGLAWISGGKVYVKNPIDEMPKATLTPCPEFHVVINGNHVAEISEVSHEDTLEITPVIYTESGFARVIISPDKMSAFIEVKLEYINTYQLEDCEPTSNLILKSKQTREINPPGTVNSLVELLSQNNVTYGIDSNAIVDFVNSPKDGLILVATGTPPGTSLDDRVEIFFKERNSMPIVENESETIDFKELLCVPSVSAGETLAKRIIGQKGEPGRTVTDQVTEAKDPKIINILPGSGVDIVEEGLRAVATYEGLPKLQKSSTNWYFSVDPVLTLPGDVNIKTGNVRFKGDVNIHGSVDNGMSISTSGNITIGGIITKCKITAGGNVTVKGNIVNAEIVSGGFIVIFNTLNPLLSELLKTLDDLNTSANLMLDKLPQNSKVFFGNVLVLLIEKRFTNLNGLLDKIHKIFKEADMKLLGSYENMLVRVVNSLTGINLLQFQTAKDFQNTISDLTSFFYYTDGLVKNRSVVNINVALNSLIKSSGDVLVNGPGCFNTNIHADGNIKIVGVARGGVIQAEDDIFINEVGSELGAKTTVIVPKDKKIKINSAFDGVSLRVGKMSRILEKNMKDIIVRLDKDGYLQLGNI